MQVYVFETQTLYELANDLPTWLPRHRGPLRLPDGGSITNAAIQLSGNPDEGIYYNPTALTYNNLDHPAWLTTFGGKNGPGIFDFGLWLPVPPIMSNPADPSSSSYIIWGPLITGSGLWYASTFRLPGVPEAPGKIVSWWGLNWTANDGTTTPTQQWFNCAKDYPARPTIPEFNWTEASRNFIALGASVNPVADAVVIPNGTVALVGLAHQRNFYKTGSANTGFASLTVNTQSIIAEGLESVRVDKPPAASQTGLLLYENGTM